MNKSLIDLSRVNKPATPPEEAPAAPKPIRQKTANTNAAKAPAATVVATVPTAQPTTIERVSTIGARIPESLHQKIRLFCIANRIEMQQFVQDGLTNHLQALEQALETNRQ